MGIESISVHVFLPALFGGCQRIGEEKLVLENITCACPLRDCHMTLDQGSRKERGSGVGENLGMKEMEETGKHNVLVDLLTS